MATNTYIALDKKTVTGSAAASVEFTSIPSTYTDLVVVINGQVSSNVTVSCQINGDTGTNYSTTELYADGSYINSFRSSTNAQIAVMGIGAQVNSGTQWVSTLNFQNYSNTTTYKTVLGKTAAPATGVNTIVGLWRSTSAINSIKLLGYAGASSFTVGTTFSLYGIKAWAEETSPKATGGYVYSDSSYYYHAFLSTSAFVPNQALSCDVLVVAGGGGGGWAGGGGGAGGYRYLTSQSLSATSYAVTVGSGGLGGTSGSKAGVSGSNSSISSISSTGGGGGGGYSSPAPSSGGSGGGAGADPGSGSQTGASGNAGSYSPVEGYAGGSSTLGASYSGGGGGATAVGSAGNATIGGNGGAGSNALSSWATVTLTGHNGYYAGGGGGHRAIGGLGGGGIGGYTGTAGEVNGRVSTGGGGGAGGANGTNGGNGGSGIVIVRYAK